MSVVIAVFSGSGGSGKSFFSSNLSYGLKFLGKKVLLAEANFGIRADDIILGIKSDSIYNFSDICSGDCKPFEAIIKSEDSCLPDFISAGIAGGILNPESGISAILKSRSSYYDYIIFDLSSCTDLIFETAVKNADISLALTDDSAISVRNTALAASRAQKLGCKTVYTVLNRVVINGVESSQCVEDIIDEVGYSLIGIIPTDEHVKHSLVNSDPIFKYNTYAGRSIENICRRVIGAASPEYETGVSNAFFFKNKLVLK